MRDSEAGYRGKSIWNKWLMKFDLSTLTITTTLYQHEAQSATNSDYNSFKALCILWKYHNIMDVYFT